MTQLPRRTVAGIGCIAGLSVAVGLTAPRWPDRWLRRDVGPLHLTRFDSRRTYERLGVRWWKRRYPEGGAWAGGESKRQLDFGDPAARQRYVVETRRAEWVHWVSCLTPLPLVLFLPWWIVTPLTAITLVVNGIAIGIVRYNRLRLYELGATGTADCVGMTVVDGHRW